MVKTVLVIGANGGIASSIVKQLCADTNNKVLTVSRSRLDYSFETQEHTVLNSGDESDVSTYISSLKNRGIKLSTVICATGVLHTSGTNTLKPEKRLEDINPEQLNEYFKVNTIIPAIWLKHLVKVLAKERANIVFFSARVGSISENVLGGWYGYRASKAALNMLVKTASIEYKRRMPNAILSCYHPGTVNTGLSKPFQGNVKPEKLFSPEFTSSQLLSHITTFSPEHSPYYFDWDGKSISY